LRLRTDDQLVSMFRSGSDDAFRAIHDRYHARLLAYSRQMLRSSGGDAEDALQDVFVRAFKALRASNRPILLRAWLYRIAHNRCIDELRRPTPVPTELDPEIRPALAAVNEHDPAAAAEQTETLARLVADVQTLPAPQRSVLLLREMQGLSYRELSDTLEISVPAVKSLLLRARAGLIDIKVARDAPCETIRIELTDAADRGVRMSGRSRRHMRECVDCRSYHGELRNLHKRLAALSPGPLAQLGLLFGFGGGAGVGSTGSVAAGGSATVLGGASAVTAAKVVAVIVTAAAIGTAGQVALHATATPAPPAAALVGTPSPAAIQVATLTGAAVAPSPPNDAGIGGSAHSTGTAPDPLTVPVGATGATGSTGVSGTTGASGASGTSGASGLTGATGTTGGVPFVSADPSGSTGDSGSDDASGTPTTTAAYPTGPTGPTATTASVSPTGSSGASGSSDQTGAGGPPAATNSR
jgi:RNA polymerase sigma factor (sigma-70 family)